MPLGGASDVAVVEATHAREGDHLPFAASREITEPTVIEQFPAAMDLPTGFPSSENAEIVIAREPAMIIHP